MGLLDALFARTKPVKSKSEALFAMTTAQITLTTKLGLTPAKRAGVAYRPVESSYFSDAEQQIEGMLQQSGRDEGLHFEKQTDNFGYRWIIVENDSFEELVAAIHMVSLTLAENGFGDQLQVAVFRFDDAQRRIYWIYNYKRGAFYPFVPRSDINKDRDNGKELELGAVMAKELPMEKATDRWYPLWNMPF